MVVRYQNNNTWSNTGNFSVAKNLREIIISNYMCNITSWAARWFDSQLPNQPIPEDRCLRRQHVAKQTPSRHFWGRHKTQHFHIKYDNWYPYCRSKVHGTILINKGYSREALATGTPHPLRHTSVPLAIAAKTDCTSDPSTPPEGWRHLQRPFAS